MRIFYSTHELSSFRFGELDVESRNRLELVDTGRLNKDSGPDFFESRVQIDDLLWVGNVEMHLRSSDWYRHNHDNDLAYNNVILHVVLENDRDVILSDGRLLPCLE